jgi:hypothetical protein
MGLSLYAIDNELEALLNASIDRETGEVLGEAIDAIEALEMARDEKALAVAAYIVGQRAEAEAVKAQAKHLAERAAKHSRHADALEGYLRAHIPEGHKLRDDRVEIGWRRSEAVEVDVEPLNLPLEFCRVTYAAAKPEIKAALKAGQDVHGCRLVQRVSLQVR